MSALVLDGVPAFPNVLSPFVSHCAPSCFPLLDGVSASPRVLSPFVSHCAPSCLPLLDGVSAFPRLLSPFVSFFLPLVGWYVRLSEGLVSFCLPLYSFLFPFAGFSLCLPLCPFLLSLVGWCVRLADVLPPIAPHCLSLIPHMCHMYACVGWCARGLVSPSLPLSPLSPIVFPTCVPVLDGVSAFPRSCLPVYPCLPLSPHMCACMFWMVCSPSRGLVSPCLPSRGLAYPCLPLNQLSPTVSDCLPTCVPVLDGVSAFPRSCLPVYPCLPLSPHMCASMFWMMCSPSRGLVSPCLPSRGLAYPCLPLNQLSPIVSHCLPTLVPVLDGVSAFSTSCLYFLSPIVSPPHGSCLVCLCWTVCPPSRGLVSPCPPLCLCWMVCRPSRGLIYPSTLVYPCLPLSPHMCACMFWMVCSPSRSLVYPCLPLNLLSPIVSHCLRTRVPVFDGLSAFTTSCLPFVSPIVTPHMCACDGMSA